MGLRCASCGYDNDPTRVFCHNCGTRIERAAEAAPPPSGFMHPTDVAKMRKPRSPVPWGKSFAALLRLAVLAGLLAIVVLAVWPPVAVPAPVPADENLARRLSGLVAASSGADGTRSFDIPAADVNRWLVSSAVPTEGEGLFGFKPERLYAVPGDGVIRIGVEVMSPPGWPVFFEGTFAPVPDAGGTGLEVRSYAVGRLPLPAAAAALLGHRFAELAGALRVPLGQLSRAEYIGITPETVTLRWSGQAR
jgi:hypothetical protein